MNEGWRELQLALAREATEAEPGIPQPGEATRLVARARERRAPAAARRGWIFGLAAAAAAAAVLLVVVLSLTSGDSAPGGTEVRPLQVSGILIVGERASDIAPLSSGERLETPDDGRAVLSLGGDRLGVAPGSSVLLGVTSETEASFSLERGRVACDVTPRTASGSFEVEAAGYVVAVRGTRFSVEIGEGDGLRVEVAEGKVEVSRDSGRVGLVEAGGYLTASPGGEVSSGTVDSEALARLDALLDERPGVAAAATVGGTTEDVETADRGAEEQAMDEGERAPVDGTAGHDRAGSPRAGRRGPGDPLATWREWVIQGRYDEAEYELAAHLAGHASDTAAWSLLADCRRKAGRWGGAVEAYRRVFQLAEPGEANRARFIAGTILQDRLGDPSAAAALYADYLSSPSTKPLAAEALVRRARCLLSTGRRADAVELLERVVDLHGGTTAAIEARRLLGEIGGSGEGNEPPAQ